MAIVNSQQWSWFARWSPTALGLGGGGSILVVAISAIEIMVYGQRFQAVPEWAIAVIVIPTLAALFIGLIGFSRYIEPASSRLALAGALTAGLGLLSLILGLSLNVILVLLGEITFTGAESVPALNVLLLSVFAMLLLSFLISGGASIFTGRPSRLIGFVLLFALVEPVFSIFFDILFTFEVPGGALTTLGVEGLALILVGYLLWTRHDHPEIRATTDGVSG